MLYLTCLAALLATAMMVSQMWGAAVELDRLENDE